jgi:hypothetical protein
MTAALVVITLFISVLVVAGLKDAKTQKTPFSVSRDKANHFHY